MKLLPLLLAGGLAADSALAQWRPREEPPVTPFTPAKLAPLTAADFPGLEIRNPESAVFLAVQYGTAKTDTIYFYLDAQKFGEVRDVLHAFAPSTNGLRALGASRGSAAKLPAPSGEEPIRGREFRFRGLESRIGEAKFRTDLVLSSGYRKPDGLHLNAFVAMEGPKGRAEYRTGRTLVEYVSMNAEGIKPVALVNTPKFRVGPGKFEPSRVSASLVLDELPMLPGAGMGRDIRITIAEEGGKRAPQQMRVPWKAKEYIGSFPFEVLATVDARFRPGSTYKISAELDLGPVFGVVNAETDFRMPEKQ